ncbi:hypothetical protein SmJEL517_g00003 [Synchytrium microbalum]|uniref:Endo-beta-1,6-galactanase-like domain-containing protein n=1 Tax=Synchytrium microbalum TaxID=1806994 RepID=A0A507C8U5_9FUNG|nr:uncharacterized protein SmJEL517_g00003 [Synchytrium microbalum]TPX38010.1 hypothetical protein SmJEL517_g00003 [Synchytrium microbalum]
MEGANKFQHSYGRPSISQHEPVHYRQPKRTSYRWCIVLGVLVLLIAAGIGAYFGITQAMKSSSSSSNSTSSGSGSAASPTPFSPVAFNASTYKPTHTLKNYNLVDGKAFYGFGVALAWWARNLGTNYWNTTTFDHVLDLLFDINKGLGLTIVRYNIGGTVTAGSCNFAYMRDMPAVQTSASAALNMEQDYAQKRTFLGAMARGVQTVEMFSSSPPQWLTKNGNTCGNWGGGSNLDSSNYQAFANYLTQVVVYYRDNYNINVFSVSPFSEPNAYWWQPGSTAQEGCHFEPSEAAAFASVLASTLKAANLNTLVAGTDEVDYAVGASVLSSIGSNSGGISKVGVHGYYDPGASARQNFKAAANAMGKTIIWMTELGTAGQDMYDNQDYTVRTLGGIGLARNIISDIVYTGATGWLYWQAVDGGTWGLLSSANGDPGNFFLGKQYYTFMQFSKWLRPGMDIIALDQSDPPSFLVARNTAAHQMVIVLKNQDFNQNSYALDISAYALGINSTSRTSNVTMAVYRTSDSENHASVALDSNNFGYGANSVVLIANVPQVSVTTVVLSGLTWSV